MKGLKQLILPGALILLAVGLLVFLFLRGTDHPLAIRVPGTDHAPETGLGTNANAVLAGKLIRSDGQPADASRRLASVPRSATAMASAPKPLPSPAPGPRASPANSGPFDVGEGYAGAAVLNGRVYLMDYDREHKQDALRCLSLADGREIWRYRLPRLRQAQPRHVPHRAGRHRPARRRHGPQVPRRLPRLRHRRTASGASTWSANSAPPSRPGTPANARSSRTARHPRARRHGRPASLPLEARTGKVLWQTPNPRGWKMTHSSIMPMEFAGQRMYVYCAQQRASSGVCGRGRRPALGNHRLEDQHRHRALAAGP